METWNGKKTCNPSVVLFLPGPHKEEEEEEELELERQRIELFGLQSQVWCVLQKVLEEVQRCADIEQFTQLALHTKNTPHRHLTFPSHFRSEPSVDMRFSRAGRTRGNLPIKNWKI